MKESVIIVAVLINQDISSSLDELECLVNTAGGNVVNRFIQRRDSIHSAYYIGKGKLAEIKSYVDDNNIDTIVFDDELFPSQQRNLEKYLDIKVIDRTRLILDIFAMRARTNEGKLQVELAQMQYLIPRLTGKGIMLSKQKGGIGTKGPGEKKLEVDLRKIRLRITKVKKELRAVKSKRFIQRKRRKEQLTPIVSLIGYTNSGKSTLLNKLTNARVLTENKLFATLDPTIRKFRFNNGQQVLFADTVGFIKKLPHELVEAFSATLEEVKEADILLHVIDGSNNSYEEQIEAVHTVLDELKIDNKQTVRVFNKIDVFSKDRLIILKQYKDSFCVSARRGDGLDSMLEYISKFLQKDKVCVKLSVPYEDIDVISFITKNSVIDDKEYGEKGIVFEGRIEKKYLGRISKYIV